jgi:hypothetical protein
MKIDEVCYSRSIRSIAEEYVSALHHKSVGHSLGLLHSKVKRLFDDVRLSVRSLARSGVSLKIGQRHETYFQLEPTSDEADFLGAYKRISVNDKHRMDRSSASGHRPDLFLTSVSLGQGCNDSSQQDKDCGYSERRPL